MKKQYIQPAMKSYGVENTEMICGSGKSGSSLGLGNPSASAPQAVDGIISAESKSVAFDLDFDEEN